MNLYCHKEKINESGSIKIEGDQLHHFRNVLRGKRGDQVRVFDGQGTVLTGAVVEVSKKELTIEVSSSQETRQFETIDQLTIGVPKKEYLESIVRSSIQIGVESINLVQTKFSPWVYSSYQRLDKIMISSLLQSENPYLPVLSVYKSLEEFLTKEIPTLLFSTELESVENFSTFDKKVNNIFIGPEGGFHESEILALQHSKSVYCARIDAPIMKAETAVPFCLGLAHQFK